MADSDASNPMGGLLAAVEDDIEPEYTRDLRIAAIFIIFFSACLGSFPPLLFKRATEGAVASIIRAFSAGVILSLALVHIYPDANDDLTGIVDFPVAGACTVFGILLLVLIENGLNTFLHAPHSHNGNTEHHHADKDIELSAHSGSRPEDEHNHACMSHDGTSSWLKSAVADDSTLRQQVFAYLMEIGCVFHSVLIGIGLGVIVDDRKQVLALLLALTFHQFLEGISLGSVVSMAAFSRSKGLHMILIYSLTTPIGIAIGIGVSSSYDPASVTAMAVQGTLNGVACGMLLYVALVQLLSEEFSRTDLAARPRLKFGMLAATTVGAGVMCMLAEWA